MFKNSRSMEMESSETCKQCWAELAFCGNPLNTSTAVAATVTKYNLFDSVFDRLSADDNNN